MEKMFEDLEARERLIRDGQDAEKLRILQMEDETFTRLLDE